MLESRRFIDCALHQNVCPPLCLQLMLDGVCRATANISCRDRRFGEREACWRTSAMVWKVDPFRKVQESDDRRLPYVGARMLRLDARRLSRQVPISAEPGIIGDIAAWPGGPI